MLLVAAALAAAPLLERNVHSAESLNGVILPTQIPNAFDADHQNQRFVADLLSEVAPTMRTDGQSVSFVHIPKNGGTTLIQMLNKTFTEDRMKGWFDPGFVGRWEQCASLLKTPDNFMITMLRNPRNQVLSQYLMCRYDEWGRATTSTDVSRATTRIEFPRKGSEAVDFRSWLSHFTNGWSTDKGDWNCYNPHNMQARALTCNERDGHNSPLSTGASPTTLTAMPQSSSVHHLWSDSPTDRAPDIVDSVNSLKDMHFVGVLELYEESWCMLQYQLNGKLPDFGCSCDEYDQLEVAHDSHGVPQTHQPIEDKTNSVLAAVDSLTEIDAQLWRHAISRLLKNLKAVQSATGRELYCEERLKTKLNAHQLGLKGAFVTSMTDRRPLSPVGSTSDHYASLTHWIAKGLDLPTTVLPMDLTQPKQFDTVRDPDFDAMLALDADKSSSGGRKRMGKYVSKLNDEASGIRAFIWPAVEVRLYGEAHNGTVLTDESGAAAFPNHWFNARRGQDPESGKATPPAVPLLSAAAHERLTVITIEALFHHEADNCFVLRQDERASHSISVPYPTSFHFLSDEAFEHHVTVVKTSERNSLAVLYAGTHSNGADSPALRAVLNRQCSRSTVCRNLFDTEEERALLRGQRAAEIGLASIVTTAAVGEVSVDEAEVKVLEDKEKRAMNLTNADVHAELRHAQFCLEPQGDTPTRSQIFESLLSGCIPVFFSSCVRADLVYERLYEPFLPRYERTAYGAGPWAVMLDSRRVLTNATYVMDELTSLARNTSQIDEMRQTIIDIMPRLQYRDVPSSLDKLQMGDASQEQYQSKYAPDALDVLSDLLQERGIVVSTRQQQRLARAAARRQ